MFIRQPAVSGTFYPESKEDLVSLIDHFYKQAAVEKFNKPPKALLVPHAGYIYSGPIAAYAYKILKGFNFTMVILIGPSHIYPPSSEAKLIACPSGFWQTPLGQVKSLSYLDFDQLKNNQLFQESIEIHKLEHCLEVQIPFLQTVLTNFAIFPLLTNGLSKSNIEQTAEIIKSILQDDTLLIVSSDLGHYLTYEEAQMVDKVTLDTILSLDLSGFEQYGDACGKAAISLLLAIAKKDYWQPKLLKSSNSGETAGGKEQVVGYASVAFIKNI